jgi:hypothetical protein
MPNPVIGMIGSSVGGSVLSANAQKKAASQASAAQIAAAEMSIKEQRRQFDAVQKLLAPYVGAGTTALSQQMALIGSSGADAQQAAINAIQASPEFGALTSAGEEAILAQGAATGGLRGGNVQGALAKFRPEILSGLINQQYSRLGGLASMGQASATGQATAAQNMGANIGNLYGQIGASQAGAALARGQAASNMFGNIAGAAGYGFGSFATPVGSPGGLPAGATLFGKWGF